MVIENLNFEEPEEEIIVSESEKKHLEMHKMEKAVSKNYDDRYEKIYSELRSLDKITESDEKYNIEDTIALIDAARIVTMSSKDIDSIEAQECINKITNDGDLKIRDRVLEILKEELEAIKALEYTK